jgi:hypothetical protein
LRRQSQARGLERTVPFLVGAVNFSPLNPKLDDLESWNENCEDLKHKNREMDPDLMLHQHLCSTGEVIGFQDAYHWLGVKYLLIFWKTGAYSATKNIGVAWRLHQTVSFIIRLSRRLRTTYLEMQQPMVCARHPMVSRIPQARHRRIGAIWKKLVLNSVLNDLFYTYDPSPNDLP